MWQDITLLRERAPLVLNITNFVAMPYTANVLLAVGASPLMAHAAEEVCELVDKADALCLNIGTPDPSWADSMLEAGEWMHSRGGVVVFDPVGAGVSHYRMDLAQGIISRCHPAIIRANASEVMALAHADGSARGVDSAVPGDQALPYAMSLARREGCVVAMSGAVDYITDGSVVEQNASGSPLMTRITATGCALSALVAAIAAVDSHPMRAASHAMVMMAVAGERAAARAAGPGSMQMLLLDELYHLSHSTLDAYETVL